VSPDYTASKSIQSPGGEYGAVDRQRFSQLAAIEITGRSLAAPEIEPFDEYAGEEIEIETRFRRKLAGLRRLPRQERPHALRAAREARQLDLKTLREKRAAERDRRYRLRQLQKVALG